MSTSGIELNNLGDNGPRISSHHPSDTVKKSSNTSDGCELDKDDLRIMLFVAGILILIAVAIAVYFCMRTQKPYWCPDHLKFHTPDYRQLGLLIGFFGGAFGLAVIKHGCDE